MENSTQTLGGQKAASLAKEGVSLIISSFSI
jgi:hypothetical protein